MEGDGKKDDFWKRERRGNGLEMKMGRERKGGERRRKKRIMIIQ